MAVYMTIITVATFEFDTREGMEEHLKFIKEHAPVAIYVSENGPPQVSITAKDNAGPLVSL